MRGAVLYAAAAVLLAGGTAWWLLAAPDDTRPAGQIDEWQRTAERLLPDTDMQQDRSTLTLDAGAEQSVSTELPSGEYSVSLICVGGPGSTVRVSLDATGFGGVGDSGLGLTCEQERSPESFPLRLTDEFRMTVSAGEDSPVIFRYSVVRIS
ncbi:hypothetical protein Ade02nite_66870 [Paractinoplanes deccanensis]|uniref:Secreted protein n=1 Tax=Paractinoplanes deccanensis TaxID=113561 RepID=A0ABQ3YDG4_9ACTN|nr:hypothetical protein Ade02nite_66870 [Actinoplanes deccanensis]